MPRPASASTSSRYRSSCAPRARARNASASASSAVALCRNASNCCLPSSTRACASSRPASPDRTRAICASKNRSSVAIRWRASARSATMAGSAAASRAIAARSVSAAARPVSYGASASSSPLMVNPRTPVSWFTIWSARSVVASRNRSARLTSPPSAPCFSSREMPRPAMIVTRISSVTPASAKTTSRSSRTRRERRSRGPCMGRSYGQSSGTPFRTAEESGIAGRLPVSRRGRQAVRNVPGAARSNGGGPPGPRRAATVQPGCPRAATPGAPERLGPLTAVRQRASPIASREGPSRDTSATLMPETFPTT